jgi:hypothetical protein
MSTFSTSELIRNSTGIASQSTQQKVKLKTKANEKLPKAMVIKVQVPYTGPGGPRSHMPMMVYNKGRDFQCQISRQEGAAAYDRIGQVVRTQGVGGAKAYFAAELKSWDELVIKVGDVLAEQPW